MKQIIDSIKEGATQGAKIGGAISASAIAMFAIVHYSGMYQGRFLKPRDWTDVMMESLIATAVFAPALLIPAGAVIGGVNGLYTWRTTKRTTDPEPVLPLHHSGQTINRKNAMRGVS